MTKKMPNIKLLLHNRSHVQWSKPRVSANCFKTKLMCTSRVHTYLNIKSAKHWTLNLQLFLSGNQNHPLDAIPMEKFLELRMNSSI